MRRLKILGIALFTLLISACTSIPLSIPSPNIAVSDFGVLNQSELITLEAGDKTFAFTARIENDGEALRVVAITPTGQRLFSLTKHGAQLDTEAGPLWPQAIPLAAVWADFAMVHVELLDHPERVVLAKDWQRVTSDSGLAVWTYRGQQQATVQRGVDQTILTKAQYQLRIEVLPE